MSVAQLSDAARLVLVEERAAAAERVAGLRHQASTLRALADRVVADLAAAERLVWQMDEVLGDAQQLPLDSLDGELRGSQLREAAVWVLRERHGADDVVHYTDWFELLENAGVRVGGKQPMATFLTQIGKAPEVESVRPRSGLYRLKAA